MRDVSQQKVMNGKLVAAFIILLANLLAAPFAEACEVTLMGNQNKPPKNYLVDKEPQGILIDMLRYVEKEMDCTFNIALYPWARAYNSSLAGLGGVIGFTKTKERLELFDYSDVMFHDDIVVVTLKGKEFRYEKITDLKGKKIGVLRAATFGDEFDRAVREGIFTVVRDNGATQRLRMLLGGGTDAALIGPGKMGLEYALQKHPLLVQSKDAFTLLPVPFVSDPNYVAFPKQMKMQLFLERFNKVLKKAQASGIFAPMISSYER